MKGRPIKDGDSTYRTRWLHGPASMKDRPVEGSDVTQLHAAGMCVLGPR
jgi:hypothetical protein